MDDMESSPQQQVDQRFVDEPPHESQRHQNDANYCATNNNHVTTESVVYTTSSLSDDTLLRISLVLLTYVIAIVVPNVQSLIALAGALAGSLTALILPPALAIKGSSGGRRACYWSWISLIFGTIFGMVGTVAALMDIVKSKE